MKIVVNKCYGGFGLSEAGLSKYIELSGTTEKVYSHNIERTDPYLVAVVESLGLEANGLYARLEVIDIPDGIEYEIDDYDGIETIREEHRSW